MLNSYYSKYTPKLYPSNVQIYPLFNLKVNILLCNNDSCISGNA